MKMLIVRLALGLALPLAAAPAIAAQSVDTPRDTAAICAEMMKDAGPEGEKAMREFMQSERAPQAMANMMEMARRMGNGDPMLGMTRMMEMMGGGGMMGGQGGMMSPPDGRSQK